MGECPHHYGETMCNRASALMCSGVKHDECGIFQRTRAEAAEAKVKRLREALTVLLARAREANQDDLEHGQPLCSDTMFLLGVAIRQAVQALREAGAGES
jgi:hypothetical protein